ncbi:MAG: hypothetical protein V3U11_09550, partial [Planctomycetota bacterium]
LLYAAWRNELAGRDPDHPVAAPALRWSVALAAIAGCLLSGPGVTELQKEFSNDARRWYPQIVPGPEESYYLRSYNPETWPDVFEYMVFDQEHRAVGPAPKLDPRLPRPWSPRHIPPTAARSFLMYPRRRFDVLAEGRVTYYVRCFLDRADGLAYVVTISGRGQPDLKPSRKALAKGPDHKPFSPRATRVGNSSDRVAMVGDEDGIWAYDVGGTADHFHEVPLPQDDRVVNWTTPHEALDPRMDSNHLVVMGEKGTYGWTGTDFVQIESPKVRATLRVVVAEPDPFTFTAVVPGDDDKTAYSHHYALYNWREKLPASVVFGASLLRIPAFQVPSFLRGDGRFSFFKSEFTDPMLAGHKRFWLLALNLLLAVFLAVLAARRLRRLGAPGSRILWWALAIALGGVPLFLFYRFIETDRAWRQAPILKPEEIPAMWIQSA